MNENLLKGLAEAIIPFLMPYLENKLKDEFRSFSKPKDEEPLLLTKKQVVSKYQVSIMTLWRWEQEGKLIPVRIGRKVMYRPSDVENILK